jgi:hypothetical protein
MELAFPWPYSQGEWLAWASAAVTVLLGLFALFAPVTALRILRLETKPDHPEAVATARASLAGFWIGVGLSCILLAQPLLYVALGLAWGITAFGRLVSMMSDGGKTLYNAAALAAELLLCAPAVLFGFGLIS